ncbi:MAG: amidohydrolase family protein [Streptosporangiales bacterium]|nr:amidohydrolase family protein [Streptosporangiales bacterium]MBO0889445.1 amidohydrolase family protein [Acidothermales bacterium]
MPVIDAHQHFWDLDRVAYPWLTPRSGTIYRTFEPQELAPQLAAAGVDATVLVQAANSFDDTEAMLDNAGRHPFIAAVVGWVPLERPDEAASAAVRFARDPVFTGVRHLIHDEPDPDWVVRDDVVGGLQVLVEHDLSFDLVALTRHLRHVPTLAERVPGLRMVIDHLAKPPIRERGWEPWASLLASAADCPGVYAKISGLNTAADPETWTADDLRPYVDHAIEVFGTDRLMFGSDWPVATLAGDYAKVWAETNALLAGLSADERAAVLGGNAARFYRIRP